MYFHIKGQWGENVLLTNSALFLLICFMNLSIKTSCDFCLYSTKSNNIVLSQKYGVKPGKKSTAIGYK